MTHSTSVAMDSRDAAVVPTKVFDVRTADAHGHSGGSVNPITGVFNFTCRESYLIENGKKTKPVKGATLIGSCMDVISNIDAVGNDLAFGPGICGKGQSAEVTAGQPTVRIRGITARSSSP